jgi:hypothetical protein
LDQCLLQGQHQGQLVQLELQPVGQALQQARLGQVPAHLEPELALAALALLDLLALEESLAELVEPDPVRHLLQNQNLGQPE